MDYIKELKEDYPHIHILIDEEGSLFYQAKDGRYFYIDQDDDGIKKYLDEDHGAVSENRPEFMCPTAVIWDNADFHKPFDLDYLIEKVQTSTTIQQ